MRPPVCILSGGETTVTLTADHGRGGRNQEFVLAAAAKLGAVGMRRRGGPERRHRRRGRPHRRRRRRGRRRDPAPGGALGLDPAAFLDRHDAYTFFDAVGGLLKTGLTQTNVMDVRVLLVGG